VASVEKDNEDSYKSYANETFDILGADIAASTSEGTNITKVTSVYDASVTTRNGGVVRVEKDN
jgi:hypothetical protein